MIHARMRADHPSLDSARQYLSPSADGRPTGRVGSDKVRWTEALALIEEQARA
jgi:hypothetical protein